LDWGFQHAYNFHHQMNQFYAFAHWFERADIWNCPSSSSDCEGSVILSLRNIGLFDLRNDDFGFNMCWSSNSFVWWNGESELKRVSSFSIWYCFEFECFNKVLGCKMISSSIGLVWRNDHFDCCWSSNWLDL
jgi:hypothetical protein